MASLKKTALAGALAGAMLPGLAAAHVTYNNSGSASGPSDGSQGGPWSAGSPGYAGNLPATWAAFIHNDGGVANSQTASSAGAGFALGMGAKAYKDGATNWGHTADFGLFQLHHEANVTISVAADGSQLRPAFGLWEGWDTGGDSSRHQDFLQNGAVQAGAPGPLGSTLSAFKDWAKADTQGPGATATLSLFLPAGYYTLILGGYDGTVAGGNLAYTATISAAAAAPVPIPAAAWLLASAAGGLGVFGRRKKTGA